MSASVFSVVFMPTLACNCRCEHCFENLTNDRISDQDWRQYFVRMRQLADRVSCRLLRVYWQGGEVLCLNPDSIQKGLDTADDVFRDIGIKLEHHLQTNLLLYDSAKWKDTISRFRLGTISSSLDFPNRYRITPSVDVDSYNRVWLSKKQESEQDGFSVSVVSLPNPATLEIGAERFYHYFRDEIGVQNLQINLPFPGLGEKLERLDLDALASFMTELYGIWRSDGERLNLSPYNSLKDRLLFNTGVLLCSWSYSCANSLIAVAPDGGVSQCDCWVATFGGYHFSTPQAGDIDSILSSENRNQFLDRPLKLVRDTRCGECDFWKLCHGGCPVRAYAFNGDMNTPDHYCKVYRAMFLEILRHRR